MAEAYIIDAVRTPVGRRGGGLSQVHPADLGGHSIKALIERTGIDPGAVDDVIFGERRQHRPPGRRHRPHVLARGRASRARARHDHRPPVRLRPAGRALRRAGRDVGHPGPGRRRRRAEHEPDPDHVGDARRASSTATRRRSPSSPGWQARYGDQEVSQFRGAELIAEKWDISREDMEAVRGRSRTSARCQRAAEGRFENEIVPLGDCTFDEGPREPNWEKIRSLPTLVPGGRRHRRGVEPDQRRIGRAARRRRAGGEGPRAEAACAHPPHQRARRRPHLHADRTDPRDRVRARARPG